MAGKVRSVCCQIAASLSALLVLLVVKLLVFGKLAQPVWEVMKLQGFMRKDFGGTEGNIVFLLTSILAVIIMMELAKRARDLVDLLYFGFLIGVLVSLASIVDTYTFTVHWKLPIYTVMTNIVGFILAAGAYGLVANMARKN